MATNNRHATELLHKIEDAEAHVNSYKIRMTVGPAITVISLGVIATVSVLVVVGFLTSGAAAAIGIPWALLAVASTIITCVYWWFEHSVEGRYNSRQWTGIGPTDKLREARRAHQNYLMED